MMNSPLLPAVGIEIGCQINMCGNLVKTFGVLRWVDDPSVVAAVRKREGDVGIGLRVNLVDRPPRSDVVRKCAHGEDRNPDVAQRNRSTVGEIAFIGQIVAQEELPQVL